MTTMTMIVVILMKMTVKLGIVIGTTAMVKLKEGIGAMRKDLNARTVEAKYV